ncbi:MAG: segregation/condensation protein A [Firmicutes bacterium]|nr:segregation/condensation protein A [Bacillota bacterium]
MGYKVKLDIFEGPFDLLVHLIERAEMSIYDIRVSEITDQYIAYLEDLKRMDVAVAGEFMVLAATLIELKSRMLLPRMQSTETDAEMEDPRQELVEKLLEYKRFKAAAAQLEIREAENLRRFVKPQEDLSVYTENPEEILNVDIAQFMKAFRLFLQRKQKIEEVHKRYDRQKRERMSIEDRIVQMKNLFTGKKKFSFRELLGGETSRYNVILTFLSLLELMRQRSITVRQDVNFGQMTITVKDPKEKTGDVPAESEA